MCNELYQVETILETRLNDLEKNEINSIFEFVARRFVLMSMDTNKSLT